MARTRDLRAPSSAGLIVAVVLALALPLAGHAQETVGPGECGPPTPGTNCGPGKGRSSAGGGEKVPHNDGAGRN